MHNYLDFEKPIAEIEGRIEELRHKVDSEGGDVAGEVTKLQAKADKLLAQAYAKLTPWQRTQVARHPDRPHALDYIKALIDDFTPLAGDRKFAEDKAIVGGLGWFKGASVVVIGNEKGSDTETRIKHNFGMARPEGYRKVVRLMELADRFHIPVLTLVDTPGAYPGVDAEARGQSEAIARSIETCLKIRVPSISVIIGEGGSGGAIALATANRVLMLENAI
ncbi:MAG: carboxyl transferase domain-containing protein, partial [Rhodospirillales bacterium]